MSITAARLDGLGNLNVINQVVEDSSLSSFSLDDTGTLYVQEIIEDSILDVPMRLDGGKLYVKNEFIESATL